MLTAAMRGLGGSKGRSWFFFFFIARGKRSFDSIDQRGRQLQHFDEKQ